MPYSLHTDVASRKRTPGVHRASPKTHTPGSQLQERGARYYSPTLGRWVSRDPSGEEVALNIFVIGQNDVIGRSVGRSVSSSERIPSVPSAMTFRLSFTPIQSGGIGKCGVFDYWIDWNLQVPSVMSSRDAWGVVVQKIHSVYWNYRCDDTIFQNLEYEFWEQWDVVSGVVISPGLGRDRWRNTPGYSPAFGFIRIDATAVYYHHGTLDPAYWIPVPSGHPCNGVVYARTDPSPSFAGLQKSNVITRWLGAGYDCCCGENDTQIVKSW